jgi:GTP-binding protein HflX
MWAHLTKQRGGIGMRGPGEKEIETDRRIIRDKIAFLKEKLREIDKQKVTQRKNRESMVRVALVGYTNVGKSTIMNMLSKSDVFAENKLFATLDTTVRKVVIGNLPFLLTDTVGFIRKLPHGLVESFKSTLDEVRESDLLIHVVDISHSSFEEQINVVKETLQEIGTADKPLFMIFNKVDAYTFIQKDEFDLTPTTKENLSLDDLKETWMAKENNPTLFISATQKINIQEFRELVYEEVKRIHIKRYPYNNLLY